MTDFAEDCIHLKACRRICKFHKINNRGCRKDYCTAYENIQTFMAVDFDNQPVKSYMFD